MEALISAEPWGGVDSVVTVLIFTSAWFAEVFLVNLAKFIFQVASEFSTFVSAVPWSGADGMGTELVRTLAWGWGITKVLFLNDTCFVSFFVTSVLPAFISAEPWGGSDGVFAVDIFTLAWIALFALLVTAAVVADFFNAALAAIEIFFNVDIPDATLVGLLVVPTFGNLTFSRAPEVASFPLAVVPGVLTFTWAVFNWLAEEVVAPTGAPPAVFVVVKVLTWS